MLAARDNKFNVVEKLIELGVNINANAPVRKLCCQHTHTHARAPARSVFATQYNRTLTGALPIAHKFLIRSDCAVI